MKEQFADFQELYEFVYPEIRKFQISHIKQGNIQASIDASSKGSTVMVVNKMNDNQAEILI